MSDSPRQFVGQRTVPYKNFRFTLHWRTAPGGSFERVAGITRVGGLRRTTQVIDYREGGDSLTTHRSPGQTSYEAITLERGLTHSEAFDDWARKVWEEGALPGSLASLADFRRDLRIDLHNEAGERVVSFEVFNCWVSDYNALPELDASGNAVAIQSLTIQNEGFKRISIPVPS